MSKEATRTSRRRFGLLAAAPEPDKLQKFFCHDSTFYRTVWKLSGNKHTLSALESVLMPSFAAGQIAREFRRMLDLKTETQNRW